MTAIYRSHVRCDRIDDMLLRNAESQGVTVHEETRVTGVDLEGDDGLITVTATGPDGEDRRFKGRFIIDCGGRDTFLENWNGWKMAHDELDRVATSAHWTGIEFNGGLDEGLLQIVYLGGEKKGRIWVIPVGAHRVSVGVVANGDFLKTRGVELRDAGSEDRRLDYYLGELKSSQFVTQLMESGTMVQLRSSMATTRIR